MWKRTIVFLGILILLSLSIRAIIVGYRYIISNDEIHYLLIAKNLLSGKGYTSDGITPHLFYPPLYPLLILVLYYLFGNLELASKLNFIFIGGLTFIPYYFLVAKIYDKKIARLSSLLLVFLPCLLLSQHFWGTASEQLYILMFISAMLFFYSALQDNKPLFSFISSFLFCLAYLTRPEGLVFLCSATTLMIIRYFVPPFKDYTEITLGKKISNILFFLVTYIIVASPYLLYLRLNLGHFTLSGKQILLDASQRLLDGMSVSQRYIPNILSEIKAFSHLGFFPFYILVFLLFSFSKLKWDRETIFKEIFLLFFFLPTFLVVAAFWVNTRYLMAALPILLIWIARGIDNFKSRNKFMAVITLSFICITFLMFKLKLANPIEYKEFGLWAKSNLSTDAKIITSGPIIAFYAERETIDYPDDVDSLLSIVEYAVENKVRYIEVDDINWQSVENKPKNLAYILSPSKAPPFLKPIYTDFKYGRSFTVYEILKKEK